MRCNFVALLAVAGLTLAACGQGDPSEPGPYTYGRGAFADTTVAQPITFDEGGAGYVITCKADQRACRRRASDLCPNGYDRITASLDGSGPSLADMAGTTSLRQGSYTIRCAGL